MAKNLGYLLLSASSIIFIITNSSSAASIPTGNSKTGKDVVEANGPEEAPNVMDDITTLPSVEERNEKLKDIEQSKEEADEKEIKAVIIEDDKESESTVPSTRGKRQWNDPDQHSYYRPNYYYRVEYHRPYCHYDHCHRGHWHRYYW